MDDLSDTDVQQTFHSWRDSDECPWYIREEYLVANGLRSRAGAVTSAKKQDDNRADEDRAADERFEAAELGLPDDEEVADDQTGIQTESSDDGGGAAKSQQGTHTIKMLYKGNLTEVSRSEQQQKRARVYNQKHSCY